MTMTISDAALDHVVAVIVCPTLLVLLTASLSTACCSTQFRHSCLSAKVPNTYSRDPVVTTLFFNIGPFDPGFYTFDFGP